MVALIPLLLSLLLDSISARLNLSDYNGTFDGYPDVILLGVQKGATTSLNTFLLFEMKLFVPTFRNKEPNFFSRNFNDEFFNLYIRGFDESKQLYGDLPTFDASPSYFSSSIIWTNLKKLYSPESLRKKKFVLSLREPVVRDISWFHHFFGNELKLNGPEVKNQENISSFHDYVQSRAFQLDRPGCYLPYLKLALEVINRDQIFILNFESLEGDEQENTLNRLLYFLGGKPIYKRRAVLPKINRAKDHCGEYCNENVLHEFLCSDLHHLNETYSSLNEGLVDFINSDPNRPVSEPVFKPFKERITDMCLDDDGSLVYFN